MTFGERIGKLRKEKNITQEGLAKQLYVTDKTISSWEQNRTEPNLDNIIKLSEILEADINYLLNGESIKNNKEIGIKIKISLKKYNYLDSFLQNNAKFIYESHQHDIYYKINKNNSEYLRIRKHGNKKTLTYKKWQNNIDCDEYEVEINSIKNLDKIFNILGLKQIVVVDKIRKIYNYNKYEISLDNVKKLGYFIEIEIKNITQDLKDEYKELLTMAKTLNLNIEDIEYNRYSYQIINKDLVS